jgi:hypothetical protein
MPGGVGGRGREVSSYPDYKKKKWNFYFVTFFSFGLLDCGFLLYQFQFLHHRKSENLKRTANFG